MNKNEVCNKIAAVCMALDNITVTGVQNAGNIAGCHGALQDILAFLVNCEIIPPDKKRQDEPSGGEVDG